MENTRSLLSRFSGLALFLLALLVVAVLVILTVNSTDNDDSDGQITDESATTSQTSEDSDNVALPDLDSGPVATNQSGNSSNSHVAGASSGEGLPNTGPEDAVLPALGVSLVVWQIGAYRRSRRMVKTSLRA
jgi:hypothetical protein